MEVILDKFKWEKLKVRAARLPRKEKDPTWGKTKKAYLTDTYNLFRIEEQDGRTWLITNLTLETKGFKELPTDWSELTEQILSMNRGVSSPTKSCWVLVNGQCNVRGAIVAHAARLPCRASSMGDIVLGKLSNHPAKSTQKGFPTLNIERYITQLASNSEFGVDFN